MPTPSKTLFVLAALALGCGPVDDPIPAAQRSTTRLPHDAAPGDDADGSDGGAPTSGEFAVDDAALGCSEDGDCTGAGAALAGGGERCAAESAGCPCPFDAPPVACDVDTGGPVTPATCYVGQRDCESGRWGACRAYRPRFQ